MKFNEIFGFGKKQELSQTEKDIQYSRDEFDRLMNLADLFERDPKFAQQQSELMLQNIESGKKKRNRGEIKFDYAEDLRNLRIEFVQAIRTRDWGSAAVAHDKFYKHFK